MIVEGLNDEYFKIISEALRLAAVFIHSIRPDGGKAAGPGVGDIASKLFQGSFAKLQQTDIDQEVKQASISATCHIISQTHDLLPSDQVSKSLLILKDRLSNEVTRNSTLKGLTIIANSAKPVAIKNEVQNLIPELNSLLKKN